MLFEIESACKFKIFQYFFILFLYLEPIPKFDRNIADCWSLSKQYAFLQSTWEQERAYHYQDFRWIMG